MLTEDRTAEIAGVKIGVGEPIVIESIEWPFSETRNQDNEDPVGNDRLFGRDRKTPGQVVMNLLVLGEDAAEADYHSRRLAAAWNNSLDETKPGAEITLSWQDGDRSRTVYGRPRKLAPNYDHSRAGLIRYTAEFVLGSELIFDQRQQSVRLDMVPPSSGGLIAPLKAPLMASGTAIRPGLIESTGGTAPTPFTASFRGPITNPWLRAPGWNITLNASLAWDETAVVDTRKGTILKNGKAMPPSTLALRTRIRNIKLAAGRTELEFGGVDSSATSYVVVSWAPAHYV